MWGYTFYIKMWIHFETAVLFYILSEIKQNLSNIHSYPILAVFWKFLAIIDSFYFSFLEFSYFN